ncbi:MAG: hypothetical protein FWG63_02570 [Defluviitaleaceae bacterium]|nr:hypothetical protein [Defluviitaleaceae bacterium]
MTIFLVMTVFSIAMKLGFLLLRLLFWAAVFGDFVVIFAGSLYLTLSWGWHTAIAILAAVALCVVWFTILKIPFVKWVFPIVFMLWFSWEFIVQIINEFRQYPLDNVWTIVIILVSTAVLAVTRFSALEMVG